MGCERAIIRTSTPEIPLSVGLWWSVHPKVGGTPFVVGQFIARSPRRNEQLIALLQTEARFFSWTEN